MLSLKLDTWVEWLVWGLITMGTGNVWFGLVVAVLIRFAYRRAVGLSFFDVP